MPKQTRVADSIISAQAAVVIAACNNGYIRIYDGAQPATADTAPSGNTLGVELRFPATSFTEHATNKGQLIAGTIAPAQASSSLSGAFTPTWARLLKSDGTTVVADISVGATSDFNAVLIPFTASTWVTCTSFTYEVLNSASGY